MKKGICEKCGYELAFDGSCEACWVENCKNRSKIDIKTTNEAIKIMGKK